VDSVVLVGDGHGVGGDAEHAIQLQHDGVDGVHARDVEAVQSLGHPAGLLDVVNVDRLGVEGDLDVVLVLVSLDGPAGAADVEAVAGAEGDAQGLYPGEVTLQV
jgi:hypothetical protein